MSRIQWAKAALQHTVRELLIGSSNQATRVADTGGLSSEYVVRQRQVDGAWTKNAAGGWTFVPSGTRYVAQGANTHERMLDISRRASEFRAGNCGENAAVAYGFIHQAFTEGRIGDSIGEVSYCCCLKPGDHAFVVIADPDDKVLNLWSPSTVICDPWGGAVMTGSQLQERQGDSLLLIPKPDIDLARLQKYIVHHRAYELCSFLT